MTGNLDRYVDVDGVRTRYWELGEGSPVVLIHGLGASAETWEKVIHPLAEGHRILAPDLIGFGYTDKPDVAYTLDRFVTFVLSFMDTVGVKRAALVGHSLGGAIGLRIAILAPERVPRLVIGDAAGIENIPGLFFKLLLIPLVGEALLSPARSKTRQALQSYFHDPSLVTDDLVDLNYDLITQPGAQRAYLSTIRHMGSLIGQRRELVRAIRDRLGDVRVPTCVLWGRQDSIVPPEHAHILADRIPDACVRLFDACGHNPMLEQPAAFYEAVRDFLASNVSNSPRPHSQPMP